MANLIALGGRAVDENLALVTNATAYFYLVGSTTPLVVYSDNTLTTALGSSVAADAEGVFPQCWTSLSKVKIDVRNGSNVSLPGFPQDNFPTFPEGGQSAGQITTTPVTGNAATNAQAFMANNTARINARDNGAALVVSSGTGGAYAITAQFTITGYAALQEFEFIANHASIGGGADTLNVDGQGGIGLRKYAGSTTKANLAAGDIGVGDAIRVKYDGTHFVIVKPIVQFASNAEIETGTETTKAVTPAGLTSYGLNVAVFRDERASGTEGGTFTSGAWQIRTLNTTQVNNITGASLSSNQISLPAGTYEVDILAPALRVNQHQARLQNITDGATTILGTSEFSEQSGTISTTPSVVRGVFTIAAAKTFEVQHRCSVTQAVNGFGGANSFGSGEVYTTVLIRRLA